MRANVTAWTLQKESMRKVHQQRVIFPPRAGHDAAEVHELYRQQMATKVRLQISSRKDLKTQMEKEELRVVM